MTGFVNGINPRGHGGTRRNGVTGAVLRAPLRPLWFALLLCTVVAMLGCAKGKDKGDSARAAAGGSAAAAGKKTFTIAMIAKSSTNPVFLSGRTGAEVAAKELSQQHGV